MTTEPLATHKLLMSEEKLQGKEDKPALKDWFSNLAIKVICVYPGADQVLDWAATKTNEITPSAAAQRPDAMMACTLSMPLYVFLTCKTKPRAANHIKRINEERRLEAWRVLRRELMGMDGPRQDEEMNAIADLSDLKASDMSKFESLYIRWESELKRHEAINREYFIEELRKRQAVDKALHDEFQKFVDFEVAKGKLQTYGYCIAFTEMCRRATGSGVCHPRSRVQQNLSAIKLEPPG